MADRYTHSRAHVKALDWLETNFRPHNPEQEEAEDHVEVEYSGEDLEIGFNVNYLLDALGEQAHPPCRGLQR